MLIIAASFAGSIWTGGTPEAKLSTATVGQYNATIQRGGWSDVVEVDLPAAPNGTVPSVSLFADHGVVEGVLGSGWGLDATSTIQRRTETGGVPDGLTTDLFRIDGMDLYLTGQCYEPEKQDDSCLEYDSETNTWLRRLDGYRWVYAEAQLIDPLGGNTLSNTASWHLVQTSDPYGNTADYSYIYATMPASLTAVWGPDTGQLLLDSISYASGQVDVTFSYGDRPDPRVDASGGTPVVLVSRLTDISVSVGSAVYSHYVVEYDDEAGTDCDGSTVTQNPSPTASLLRRVTRTDGTTSGLSKQLRCASYHTESNTWTDAPGASSGGVDYTASIPRPLVPANSSPSYTFKNRWNVPLAANLNGDAFPDLIVLGWECNPLLGPNAAHPDGFAQMLDVPPGQCAVDHDVYININATPSVQYWGEVPYLPDFDASDPIAVAWEAELEATLDASFAASNGGYAIVDLDGDGLPELIYEDSGTNEVKQFDPGTLTFSAPMSLGMSWTYDNPLKHGSFADVDGDGLTDLIVGYTAGAWPTSPTDPEWYRNDGQLDLVLEGVYDHPVDLAGFSSCGSNQTEVPGKAVGFNLPVEIFRSRQTSFTDVNGDGLTDAVLALYQCWDEYQPPTNDPNDKYEVPDTTTAYSTIFLGDGRGNFYETDLSAGRSCSSRTTRTTSCRTTTTTSTAGAATSPCWTWTGADIRT